MLADENLHQSFPGYDNELVAGELISKVLVCCPAHTSLQDAARQMYQQQISCILVGSAEQILGIWTESDAKTLNLQDPATLAQPISNVMSSPVTCVDYDCSMSDAAALMKQKRIRRLLVKDQHQQPAGILTQTDIISHQRIEHYLMFRDVGSSISRPPLQIGSALDIEIAIQSMLQHSTDAAIVHFPDGSVGIITERDLVAMIASGTPFGTVAQLARKPLLSIHQETSLLHAVGLLKQHSYRHLGITNTQGELIGLLSYNDILQNVEYAYVNQLKAALDARDQALRTSADHLRLAHKVIEASLDAIMITDANGVIQSVNPSFTTLTGYTAAEAIGNTPAMLSSGKHDQAFYQDMWSELFQQGYWQGEIWNRRKNGEVYPEWLSVSAIKDEYGNINQFAAIFSDMTDRKTKEKQIHTLAYFDELTGLANRRLFLDRLQLALANARRHSHQMVVLFLDLDLFKRINDTLGHQAGDATLKEVAHRLSKTLRAGESAARLGGDEFTILLPECGKLSDAEQLAKRIVAQFEQPLQINQHELFLTASIGISVYPQHGNTADQLLKHADAAMYQAKESGRNQYAFYNDLLGQQHRKELHMEQALRMALRQQELHIHYQPKILLSTGQLHSAEALLRWHDQKQGYISPASFIPLAEKLGLINQMGDWVLQQVCQQLADWGNRAIPVAVNISAIQLSDQYFLPRLQSILQKTGIAPELLELELTESCLIQEQADYTLQLLTQLRRLGVRLSIDDFGTGYSSLSYLRHLPINSLKIDRSFVSSLPENPSDNQITRAIIAMAHALGLDVIAEGIEQQTQLEFLLQAGCNIGQGYLFAQALPATEFERWL
ncbi:EAL domain-containing protein [Chromatiaceae bacterium AAb-1]|nr:EAL domain-containing protein [Chromatiaceae bacterium AAb-1]